MIHRQNKYVKDMKDKISILEIGENKKIYIK